METIMFFSLSRQLDWLSYPCCSAVFFTLILLSEMANNYEKGNSVCRSNSSILCSGFGKYFYLAKRCLFLNELDVKFISTKSVPELGVFDLLFFFFFENCFDFANEFISQSR